MTREALPGRRTRSPIWSIRTWAPSSAVVLTLCLLGGCANQGAMTDIAAAPGRSVATGLMPATEPTAMPQSSPDTPWSRDVLMQARPIADWRLENPPRLKDGTAGSTACELTALINATTYLGLADFGAISSDARFGDAVVAGGRAFGWATSDGAGGCQQSAYQNDVIRLAWFSAAARVDGSERQEWLQPTLDRLNQTLATLDVAGAAPCPERSSCRRDTDFLAIALWAEASRLTGDPRYLAHGDNRFRTTFEPLYETNTFLFHDHVGAPADAAGAGTSALYNGLAYAGLARTIEAIPADNPARLYYVALYREMSRTIIARQRNDGHWSDGLQREDDGPPDMMASALFIYGLAWGLNTQMLSFNEGETAALSGWAALTRSLQADGVLSNAPDTGSSLRPGGRNPSPSDAAGAYLMATAQIAERKW